MAGEETRRAVLIAGPTASGKTAHAIARARAGGGLIVNTDSMQVYGVLDRLTARPDPAELAAAEHVLFGHVDPARRYSTGAWLADVQAVIQGSASARQPLIFVGGTGLYFDALTKGFAPIPPVPHAVIQAVEARVSVLDAHGRMALLAELDPDLADRLEVADPQRVVRALSVLEATGRPLSAYLADDQPAPLAGWDLERIVLMPQRAVLRRRIAERFAAMMDAGAVEEVEALLALGLDPGLPAMKAIGVPQIADMLAGRLSRDAAIESAVTATRQYAKRQSTWFRNRMGDWTVLDPFASDV
ncbi:tRNA (adenosine(37)-N6)-dimethylallyltransferase MiaA [Pelagibacterium montanilacus]|uniref:tRNA (adenosine(37)-N6)-dimethylallyltransferase MiaA n=1 Tax=Pelagibacterium montanilacus TaxID=2185280 RepID=UPI000F8CCB3B|nr:tRNA (adenosine(37)-N6)-dimethylallyltransferase MiaA [Pelagibacterium montanilacus]